MCFETAVVHLGLHSTAPAARSQEPNSKQCHPSPGNAVMSSYSNGEARCEPNVCLKIRSLRSPAKFYSYSKPQINQVEVQTSQSVLQQHCELEFSGWATTQLQLQTEKHSSTSPAS